jgi:type IV secretory pathway VirD2 relaxase
VQLRRTSFGMAMRNRDTERPFRLRPRRPPRGANRESDRRCAHGLRRLLRIVQMSGRRGKSSGARSPRAAKFHQRVAVRVIYSTNKTPGQWRAHGHYIARESATQRENIKAVGFSAAETAVDVAQRLASWQSAGDERMFKIIVSPEFGEWMDLEKHTRDLMSRIERSLLTKLEWVAVVHHNTEHPHVHVALRGLDDRGAALRLPRAFIQSGIRRHAEELATRELGFRTERDALEAQRREVQQLRFTSLDRIILRSRSENANYFTVHREPVGTTSFARTHEHYVQARLVKLEQMGLAARTTRHTWLVRGDFEGILRTLQRTNDRQKMLARHAALVSDERLPLQVTLVPGISVLEGRVLGHGHEEVSDRPYLLLEGVDGRIHLLWQNPQIEAKRRQGLLGVNSFARIEKHLAGGRSFLTVLDFGNSWKLLQNDAYFRQAAERLLQSGVQRVDPSWGGWLGAYQKKLSTKLIAMRDHEHLHKREISRGR